MFEIGGVSEDIAKEALRRAIDKLPMKCALSHVKVVISDGSRYR